MLEIKVWILGGAVSVLIVILGVFYSMLKYAINNFLKKFDELIREVHALNNKNALREKEVAELNSVIKEIKEQHQRCINYKPARR